MWLRDLAIMCNVQTEGLCIVTSLQVPQVVRTVLIRRDLCDMCEAGLKVQAHPHDQASRSEQHV